MIHLPLSWGAATGKVGAPCIGTSNSSAAYKHGMYLIICGGGKAFQVLGNKIDSMNETAFRCRIRVLCTRWKSRVYRGIPETYRGRKWCLFVLEGVSICGCLALFLPRL